MRLWRVGVWGLLGLALSGCQEPDQIIPVTPPGAVIPRTPPDADNPAQAQGEAAVSAPKTSGDTAKPVPYTPALPTAKGETKTTKNGVKYETLKEGTGVEIKPGQVARVFYEGKLENGTVFDTNRGRGTPAPMTIGSGQLIRGWEEAIPGMRVGEIRKMTIPPALGYGDTDHGQIPANSTLIFEVELVGVN